MAVCKPIPIKTFDFSPYGRYWDLRRERCVKAETYEAYMTVDPPMERPLRFGMTVCENGGTFPVDTMERHLSTEEILFAGDKPIVPVSYTHLGLESIYAPGFFYFPQKRPCPAHSDFNQLCQRRWKHLLAAPFSVKMGQWRAL